MVRKCGKLVLAIAIILLGIWFAFPSYWTLQTSFLTKFAFISPIKAWQISSLANWRALPWRLFGGWFRNSLIVCISVSTLRMFVCVLAGYGFAKFDFPMKDSLFWVFLIAMVVPGTLLFLPKYLITRDMGLFNTYFAMILPLILQPSMVFFSRQYLLSISNEVIDAARVDGASEPAVFRYVILPLALPLIVLVLLGGFSAGWGDFMWQYIVARDNEIQTLTVGMGLFMIGVTADIPGSAATGATLAGMQSAAGILLAIPGALLFVFGQKYFLQGIKLGVME